MNIRYFQSLARLTLVSAVCFGILSCATSGSIPIANREPPPSRKINIHEVQPDETIYSIAWRYETDYRDMARINGLVEPYRISARQRLKIYDDGSAVPARDTVSRSQTSSSNSASVRTAPVVSTSSTVSTRTSSAPTPTTTSTPTLTSTPPPTTSTSSQSSSSVNLPVGVSAWRWPVQGRVVSAFGADELTKGIALDPGAEKLVGAAADGVVVYAGTGMRGFGNLLIVKHTDILLSAYAYNSELLAREGDQVRAGQSIARVGLGSDGQPRVYFEIRKDGKPVDPIGYLPKR